MKRNTHPPNRQIQNSLLILKFTILFILMMYLAACGESLNPVGESIDNHTIEIKTAPNLEEYLDAPWDVNGDGIVDILDMIIVAEHFGEVVPTRGNIIMNNQMPPAPVGVYSITSDKQVTLRWLDSGIENVASYQIWRSRQEFENYDLIGDIPRTKTEYIDRDVRNGETYYYAIVAVDNQGNASDLSYETVWDTPRPEGFDFTLWEASVYPWRSGCDLSKIQQGTIAWDAAETDIYFAFDEEVNIAYLNSDNDTLMQDMGFHETMDDLDISPERGFTTLFVELIEGHIYALYTPDGNYAKIQVKKVSDSSVTFDWAYQLQRDNPQLAPAFKQLQF